jgi:hypothetical protein
MNKKIFFVLFILISFLFVFSCNFNLFRPKNMADLIKNLPKEEQLKIAEDALGNVSSAEEAGQILDSLLSSWGQDLSNGAQTESEAKAAYLIAQAYLLSDPVLFETFDLIKNLATGQNYNSSGLAEIFSNLSDSVSALNNAIDAIVNAAQYLNYYAQYDAQDGVIDNPAAQILNALFNVVAYVDNLQVDWTDKNEVNTAFSDIDFNNTGGNQNLEAAKASLNAVVNAPNVAQPLKDIANALLRL